ncbi:CRP-like cAMP-binding protein [Clostridium acetobutylicum]|uniref:cAMP-binding domain (Catabolite gene activator) and regulatory subunit of cAMP-dependent protein kinase n=1 Tax=Clostridium acetobutylicum (strain ATCC 824 / DSM 792 / JCM 1419 / IAM 19013 / LMG 5710 / NBRC 13948 / NRRL B-527 / VKM B-1787 / 2291 / W) TaxID=272562 RepID=Q97KN3_CLOAB|nr:MULTISPECIES: Crp/Fnr family transcriptional regulator [Clostridium]AAK78860.1 CAMP-binding domain (catabolite gene activator) and regulatory subunit of cAMP-dependent protein kinase [Clostridium acetobutylicum ATCC 824]ADZ19935.1 CAMP-binding domain (catabolite gene activator) and regulatory subunit of cAMP-dependent protein kinase [Clostridium acetobutylicum EA 2018]AEI33412.1 cAMP-binding domain-containing protein [Clostridium acetobutylicum DSM 1731]AWV80579.1 Crp/Fnr family transcriptio
MDKKILTVLKHCILFSKIETQEIDHLFSSINYSIKEYYKDETIAIEGDTCNKIGIVLSGCVEIQKIYESGKSLTITTLEESKIFGEAIIFSNKTSYPSTIIACTKSTIIFIPKASISKLCSDNSLFLNGFMSLLSNKILMLNKKLKNMSYHTIREKISNYILEQYEAQNNLTFKMNKSKKQLSEMLGIPRPSLSREFINLREEGIIDFDRTSITILDINSLKEILEAAE